MKKYDADKESSTYKDTFQSSKIKYLQSALKYLFSNNSNLKTHFTYYGRTKLKVIRIMLINEIKKRYRKYFINKNLIHNIENQRPFVYFPLQTDPERSILIAAPRFSNQIEVITNIAKSLPDGYDLYVKEHPLMILREWRSISDYKQIMSLPNVKLFHPYVKSDNIIKKSSLVISINSTSGLEAGFYGKPSITFSDQDFSYLSFVHQVKSFQELPDAIKKSLKKKVNISDLNNYVNLIESNSFETDLFGTSAYFDNLFHYGGFFVNVDIPVQKMKCYLDTTNEIYEKVAIQFAKKITN